MKTQEKQDEFIRKLISRKGVETTPADFTERVMGQIKTTPAADDSPLLSKGSWIALILSMAAVITLIFIVDIPYIDMIFSSTGIQKVSMNIFSQGFFDTMVSFFKGLNLSSITWMTIAAATGLVVLDRLLRKRFSETGLLMVL